jgi:hypothetical protein
MTSGNRIGETPSQPRILLVEPDQHLLDCRSLLLTKSNFRVLTASNACEAYHLRNVQVNLAVLSDRLGPKGLRAAAECVREQWPTAQILVLGVVEASLEDYLYDESVDHRFQPDRLLDSIVRLAQISQGRSDRQDGCSSDLSSGQNMRRTPSVATRPEGMSSAGGRRTSAWSHAFERCSERSKM